MLPHLNIRAPQIAVHRDEVRCDFSTTLGDRCGKQDASSGFDVNWCRLGETYHPRRKFSSAGGSEPMAGGGAQEEEGGGSEARAGSAGRQKEASNRPR